MGWRDAPVQNSSWKGCNGYLRVAQDRWRGAPARELVQNLCIQLWENGSIIIISITSLFSNPYHKILHLPTHFINKIHTKL
ncbi:hypothetical protein A2U01_0054563 [Trifolium medium]|uniref:Uncharacterized protein n=1 Tax=Trifolium medium TaxID=97028 RepID=A0A392RBX8_9FABA|nr:hypothetical protein [Trifolium medium]